MTNLLNHQELEKSSVVANNSMNRQRGITGVNSYEQDLGWNIINWLEERLQKNKPVSWLDVCCGEGNALIQTATCFYDKGCKDDIQLTGIDLVDYYAPYPVSYNHLNFITDSIHEYVFKEKFDLITCIHGLHYIGDKLGTIIKLASYLKKGGLMEANIDLKHIEIAGDKTGKLLKAFFKKTGILYKAKRNILSVSDPEKLNNPFIYLGADDEAGANYTGQSAVKSYYKID